MLAVNLFLVSQLTRKFSSQILFKLIVGCNGAAGTTKNNGGCFGTKSKLTDACDNPRK